MRLHTTLAIIPVLSAFLDAATATECLNEPGDLCQFTKRSLRVRGRFAPLHRRQSEEEEEDVDITKTCQVCGDQVCWIAGDKVACTDLRIRTITRTTTVMKTSTMWQKTATGKTVTAWTTMTEGGTATASPAARRKKRQDNRVDWMNTSTQWITKTMEATITRQAGSMETAADKTVWRTTVVPAATAEAQAGSQEQTSSSSSKSEKSVGGIVGGILGGLAALALVIFIIATMFSRRRKPEEDESTPNEKFSTPNDNDSEVQMRAWASGSPRGSIHESIPATAVAMPVRYSRPPTIISTQTNKHARTSSGPSQNHSPLQLTPVGPELSLDGSTFPMSPVSPIEPPAPWPLGDISGNGRSPTGSSLHSGWSQTPSIPRKPVPVRS